MVKYDKLLYYEITSDILLQFTIINVDNELLKRINK